MTASHTAKRAAVSPHGMLGATITATAVCLCSAGGKGVARRSQPHLCHSLTGATGRQRKPDESAQTRWRCERAADAAGREAVRAQRWAGAQAVSLRVVNRAQVVVAPTRWLAVIHRVVCRAGQEAFTAITDEVERWAGVRRRVSWHAGGPQEQGECAARKVRPAKEATADLHAHRCCSQAWQRDS